MNWKFNEKTNKWNCSIGNTHYEITRIFYDPEKNQEHYVVAIHTYHNLLIDNIQASFAEIQYVRTDATIAKHREKENLTFNSLEAAQKIVKYLIFS